MLNRILRRTMLALLLGASAARATADTLHVEIDTSSLGSDGWIDLSFLSSNQPATLVTATLSDFIGFNAAGAQPWGGVSGSLSEGYTLSNLGQGADLFHAVNFGGKVSFNVEFSGVVDAAVNRAQSTLSVSLYGADQTTLLGDGDAASGSLLQLFWTPSKTSATPGTVSYQVYDNIASVGPVAAVPEPSTWTMLGLGIGLLGLMGRRRQAGARFVAA